MQTSVYAAYGPSGELLYIGASVDVKRRLSQHKSISCWGRSVCRVVTKPFPTKQAAFRFESRAIEILCPAHNVAVYQGVPHLHRKRSVKAQKDFEAWRHKRTGLDIKATWVRDKVKQRFGSAKRNPN